ncbi:MAG TPA: maltotransferase domain-containing protein, partial [Nitrospira sp.]|nr:maltotransferase domain-containing protein [Nitrospira sp.]
MTQQDGRQRVAIENVRPEIDGGRFPIKRTVGEEVVVEADAFADGHDVIAVVLRYRHADSTEWTDVSMKHLGNDRWRAVFHVNTLGQWHYTIAGWVDHFETWRRDLVKKLDAGQNLQVDLLIGAKLIDGAVTRASTDDGRKLAAWRQALRSNESPDDDRIRIALSADLQALMARYPDRRLAST